MSINHFLTNDNESWKQIWVYKINGKTPASFEDLSANSVLYTNETGNVQTYNLNDGELLIGSTGTYPVVGGINGYPNQVLVTNGPGTINLNLPQDINVDSSPTFNNLVITNDISANNISVSGNINLPNIININNLSVSENANIGGLLSSNDINAMDLSCNNINILNDATVSGDVIIEGNIDISGSISGSNIAIYDNNSGYNLLIDSNSSLTSNKQLTFNVNDNNRIISLGGDISTSSNFTTNGSSISLTATGLTNITLPTIGTLSTLSGNETLTNKTLLDPIISQISHNGTLGLPNGVDTLVARNSVDTLTNKTLTDPNISTIINIGTLTLPTSTDVLIGRITNDTLSNKTLNDSSVFFFSNSNPTKRLGFNASGVTSNETRIFSVPDLNDTLVGTTATQTLTNKTIVGTIITNALSLSDTTNQITTGTSPNLTVSNYPAPSGSVTLTFPNTATTIVGNNTTNTLTNKTLVSPIMSNIINTGTLSLPTSTDTLIGRSTTDTLTNKLLSNPTCFHVDSGDNTKRIGYSTNSATTGTTVTLNSAQTANRTLTLPDMTTNLIGNNTADTLTNKTLTAPNISTIINTGTLSLPTSTDTLIGRNTTDTLTNKTLTLPVIASISNSGTVTIPAGTDTLVNLSSSQILSNKDNINVALTVTANAYTTGTASQSTTTVTGVGTTWSQSMVGGLIRWQFGARSHITGFTSTTSLTVTPSQTVSSQNYTIYYQGLESSNTGITGLNNIYVVGSTNLYTTSNQIITGQGSNLTTCNFPASSGAVTLTFPNTSQTIVGRSTVDTLTNKTLTLPEISAITNTTGILAVPTIVGTDTLVCRNATETLTNKTLTNPIINTPSQIPFNVLSGITAFAAGGQASATPLTQYAFNTVTTVGMIGASVLLPAATVGKWLYVSNYTMTLSMNVYPTSGEQINALGTNNPQALGTITIRLYYCDTSGHWVGL